MAFNLLKPKLHVLFLLIVILLAYSKTYAQTDDDKLIDAFEYYAAAPREIVYTQLNKSTYIKGEMMGFKAYVFDKYTKERSEMTTNLYCTISDTEGNVVKKKMLFVQDGVVANIFKIDDSLSTGTYIFKAYTNWMLNFKELNHFQQAFNVLDASTNDIIKKKRDDVLDIQVLGEGGHIVTGVINSLGIIVKNSSGRGLSGAKGSIINDLGEVQTEFTLNDFGLAKAILKPDAKRNYTVRIDHLDTFQQTEVKGITTKGFSMTLSDLGKAIALSFSTNESAFEMLKSETFKLAIHNGDEMSVLPIQFENSTERRVIPKENLLKGMNVITVMTNENEPILERLFFNRPEKTNSFVELVRTQKLRDSVDLTFKINNFDNRFFNSLSASILPETTESYEHNHNLQSQLYLQPYINGPVENAGYYFTNSDRKADYDLDLLLLTQGWSSYDWTDIFNFEDNFLHPFERGIDVVATVNDNDKGGVYLVYPLINNSTQIFTLGANEKIFTQKRVVPYTGEAFRVGRVQSNKKQKKPGVYPQFYPSKFKFFNETSPYLSPQLDKFSINTVTPVALNSWNRVEELDEVVIEGKSRQERLEKLKSQAISSRIYDISDADKRLGVPLDQMINDMGFVARYDFVNAVFTVINPRVFRGNPTPLVYLDGALLGDLNILRDINSNSIDYVEYDLYGQGGGLRGYAGFIKIYSDYEFSGQYSGKADTTSAYEFPLTFDEDQKFYTPVYQFYSTPFFKKFGTIAWFPYLQGNDKGEFTVRVLDTQAETYSLFLEGVVNNNQTISVSESIKIEN